MGKRKSMTPAHAITQRTIRHASGGVFVTLTDAVTGDSARLSFPTIEDALRAEAFLALLTRAIPEASPVVVVSPVDAPAVVGAVKPRRPSAQRKVGVAA
jgi:hypothetical protein